MEDKNLDATLCGVCQCCGEPWPEPLRGAYGVDISRDGKGRVAIKMHMRTGHKLALFYEPADAAELGRAIIEASSA